MKKMFSACLVLVVLAMIASALLMPALAEEAAAPAAEPQTEAVTATDNSTGSKAIAAAVVVGVVATAGAIGMALAISKSTSGMARQPEVAGKINSAMMLGLVFIETAIIYALIVAILIIFVL